MTNSICVSYYNVFSEFFIPFSCLSPAFILMPESVFKTKSNHTSPILKTSDDVSLTTEQSPGPRDDVQDPPLCFKPYYHGHNLVNSYTCYARLLTIPSAYCSNFCPELERRQAPSSTTSILGKFSCSVSSVPALLTSTPFFTPEN